MFGMIPLWWSQLWFFTCLLQGQIGVWSTTTHRPFQGSSKESLEKTATKQPTSWLNMRKGCEEFLIKNDRMTRSLPPGFWSARCYKRRPKKQFQAKSRQLASLLALQVLATSGQLIPCPGKILTVLHMTGLNFSQCQGMWTKHDKVHLFLDGNSRSSRAYFAENWYSSCVGVSFREGLFSGTTLVLARLILKSGDLSIGMECWKLHVGPFGWASFTGHFGFHRADIYLAMHQSPLQRWSSPQAWNLWWWRSPAIQLRWRIFHFLKDVIY